ncbi:MAG TPA: hypothetical protein PK735_15465 [Flavobacteriales bacterium]|nr:hypothetical protein [Flavobacteriales bacterium]
MNKRKFKTGDYVFYHNKELGSLPCKVTKVYDSGLIAVTVSGPNRKVVSASKCQLQEEWAKENEQ